MSGAAPAGAGAAPTRRGPWRDLWRDASPSAVGAGFLAMLVSCAGPLLVYLQAARAMGVSEEAFSSWVFAIWMAAGLASIGLSLATRAPILVAWSAPGTVLLIASGPGLAMAEIVGAYLAVAAALLLIGLTGAFERLVRLVPGAVASGLLAGILFRFGADAMGGLATAPLTFAVLLGAFVALSVAAPRHALLALLALALALAALLHDLRPGALAPEPARLALTAPAFSAEALLGLGLPLLVATLTGQFLPGVAILRGAGYPAPTRAILGWCAAASIPSALLGGVTTSLAAITMALGTSPECHPDPRRRYVAGVASGAFFVLGALLAGSVIGLLTQLPVEIVALLAGLALLGAIGRSLGDALASPEGAQAGLLTFLVTASGASLGGVGAAFWGVAAGLAAVGVQGGVRRAMGGGR